MKDRKLIKTGFIAVFVFVCMAFGSVAAQENIMQDTTVYEEDTTVYEKVEQMPEFPGGYSAMWQFIRDNFLISRGIRECVQGIIVVGCIVEKDGSLANFEIKRGVVPIIDEEALRVVRLMPKWIPGMQKGKAVRTKIVIPMELTRL